MPEKKGSGTLFWLHTFEKELPEWHSGVFCHKNTTVYKYTPISQSISHNYFLKNGPRSDGVSHKKGTTDENQVFISCALYIHAPTTLGKTVISGQTVIGKNTLTE
jgi:hypothetical protein